MTASAEKPPRRQKVGLVIGSGGIKCAAGIGLYKVLEREGIPIDLVVGCSGGSVVGSLIACGFSAQELQDKVLNLWTRKAMTRFTLRAALQVVLPRWFGFDESFALVNDQLMMQNLYHAFGERTFADTKIPAFVVASDIKDGAKVVISEGKLRDGVRASIGIPILFGPHQVDGRWLIDGGMVDPLPIDVAIRENCDLIIAMGFESPYHSAIRSLSDNLLHMTSVSINNLTKATFAFYNLAHHAEIISLMMRFDRYVDLFDTHLLPYIIEQGEKIAEANLPHIRSALEAPA